MKYAIVLLIFLVSSCKGKTNNQLPKNELITKTGQNFSEEQQEEKITDEELRVFLQKFKNALTNNDIASVSEMVHFPLDGDAIYYMVYGDIVFEKGLELFINTIDKEVFKKNFSKIFSNETIFLFKNLDIEKAIKEKEFRWETKEGEGKILISSYLESNQLIINTAFVSDIDDYYSYGYSFKFKKINGKILLYEAG